MLVIPAIDIHEGRCVRLRQGDRARRTVYADDPEVVAARFVDAGVTRLHVVDLDSARGAPDRSSIDAAWRVVARATGAGCAVQVGGGVRTVDDATRWLDAGAAFIVLGSVAARAPETALAICAVAGTRVLLGLDVRSGTAMVQGWTESARAMTELLREWRDWPVAGLIYTDTTRDGMLAGPNLSGLDTCRELFGGPVHVSGGITTLDDLVACDTHGAAGVIVGRAIHEGTIDLAAALTVAAGRAG